MTVYLFSKVLGCLGMGIGVLRYGYWDIEVWVLGCRGMGIGVSRYGYWGIEIWVLGY